MAREYGWLPCQSDTLDWAEALKYMEKISAREQNREKEKIEEYIMLVHIVHTTAPDKLAESLRNALMGKTLDNETGDLQKLKALKAKMEGGRIRGY